MNYKYGSESGFIEKVTYETEFEVNQTINMNFLIGHALVNFVS